jgi:hypothetical protein
MRHVPEYLIPQKKINVSAGATVGYVPFKIQKKRRGTKNHRKPTGAAAKRRADPLKGLTLSSK